MDSRDPITSVTSHRCVSASRSCIPTVDSAHGQACFFCSLTLSRPLSSPARPFREQGWVRFMVCVFKKGFCPSVVLSYSVLCLFRVMGESIDVKSCTFEYLWHLLKNVYITTGKVFNTIAQGGWGVSADQWLAVAHTGWLTHSSFMFRTQCWFVDWSCSATCKQASVQLLCFIERDSKVKWSCELESVCWNLISAQKVDVICELIL